MVKVIKDIIDRLDGYSFDGQGFAVTSFATVEGSGVSRIKLQVKPYIKNEESEWIPEEKHLMEMIKRLLSQYADAPHYTVYKAEKVSGFWEMVVQEIQEEDKTDEVKE